MAQQLLFLELNEVNAEAIGYYTERGHLPNFRRLVAEHGWSTTTSEARYDELEPWIQWVTAHTGLTLAEHGVFRLGDIVSRDLPQIWERLEREGLIVGAVSPMNAKHRLREPAFFVPDPWTATKVSAPWLMRRMYRAICQVVNDNAQAKVGLGSLFALSAGLLRYGRIANFRRYIWNGATSFRGAPWRRAVFLDMLLADVFIGCVKSSKPHFATLFLNAAAHIQHHYMFSSASYPGHHRNPDWYVPAKVDPVYEVYKTYDRILGDVIREFPAARIMLATGLHQVPHGGVTYYWRLKNHSAFLREIGVSFSRVEPRMSRDFLVVCEGADQARSAENRLSQACAKDGTRLFDVENRGADLFVTLTYPRQIEAGFRCFIGDQVISGLHDHVAFVALKNGEHSGVGYFLDTGVGRSCAPAEFELREMPARILQAFGLAQHVPDLAGTNGFEGVRVA